MVEDDTDLKDSVQRLHRFVVDALRARREDPFASPVTVAEIYQDLASYRTVRTVLGFEMNADYEHALVRMLAGVDGLAKLDPPEARDRLQKELDSPNPDVTMYRDYAGCDVVLNPPSPQADWVREQLDEDEPEAELELALDEAVEDDIEEAAEDWSALAALSRSEPAWDVDEMQDDHSGARDDGTDDHDDNDRFVDSVVARNDSVFQLESDDDARPYEPAGATRQTPADCGHCGSRLPQHRALRFCPYCGTDQSKRPCASCGEVVEAGWSFCIACGTTVA